MTSFTSIVGAQVSQNEVYVCVEPINSETEPYFIHFKNTSAFGLVILEEQARITVYSGSRLSAVLHSIRSDAASGGYQLDENIALVRSSDRDIVGNDVCDVLVSDVLTSVPTTNTVSLPTSSEYILSVDTNAPNNFISPDLRGAFSFHFQQAAPRFQIVQQGAGSIEVTFPFLDNPVESNNAFIVISNKDSLVIEEDVNIPASGNYINPQSMISRDDFVTVLSGAGEDLYGIMSSDGVHIFPNSGQFIRTYATGRFLRLSALAPPPERNFEPGDVIVRLGGGEIDYYALEDPSRRDSLPRATVRRLGDSGDLIVGAGSDATTPDLVVTEPWLMIVVEDQE